MVGELRYSSVANCRVIFLGIALRLGGGGGVGRKKNGGVCGGGVGLDGADNQNVLCYNLEKSKGGVESLLLLLSRGW